MHQSLEIRLIDQAIEEINFAYDFYEFQQKVLGEKFLHSLG